MCSGKCKKYRVVKPTGKGRCESGYARCQICDIWIDYTGVRLKDGSHATQDFEGGFCNCCNYSVSRKPRNIEYKAKLRQSNSEIGGDIDLSYFNKRRAHMIRHLAMAIVQKESEYSNKYLLSKNSKTDIESEFGTDLDVLVELAKQTDPPNKISLIVKFEQLRHMLDRIPTKEDIEKIFKFDLIQYETEFGTWENFLERLGYDPWYRQEHELSESTGQTNQEKHEYYLQSTYSENIIDIKKTLKNYLKDEPEMLRLFMLIDQNITKLSSEEIKALMSITEQD